MLKKIVLASTLLSAPALSSDSPPDVVCLGKSQAPQIIYMHGIDPVDMSPQEIGNREMLDDLGKEIGVGFAAVRAENKCATGMFKGRLCWPFAGVEDLQTESKRLVKLTQTKCGKDIVGWLGFSNGGYFVSKLVQYCVPTPGWKIAVGSAGSWQAKDSSGLAMCSPLLVAMGRRDMTLSKAHRYVKHLQSRGAKAEIVEFDGGHQLKRDVLKSLLRMKGSR